MRIFLVGYMGAGKTTTGKRLARRLGLDCYDTDHLFEEKYCISTDDFFHKYDEPLYRKLEAQVLRSTEQYDNVVISTGGGTACFFDNIDWMNEHGITIFLKISPQTVIDRLSKSKVKRPLVMGKSIEELTDFVHKTYTERMPFYEKAQLVFKGENCDLEAIVEALRELNPELSIPTA